MITPHNFVNNILEETTCTNIGIKTSPVALQYINYDLAYIKHFIAKTIEEYLKYKYVRGVGDRSHDTFKELWDIFNSFFKINEKTPEKIEYINNYEKRIK